LVVSASEAHRRGPRSRPQAAQGARSPGLPREPASGAVRCLGEASTIESIITHLRRATMSSFVERRQQREREPLWDARDVAAYLKASRSWVYMKAEAGQLPCIRIGGLLRFHRSAVEAFARGEHG